MFLKSDNRNIQRLLIILFSGVTRITLGYVIITHILFSWMVAVLTAVVHTKSSFERVDIVSQRANPRSWLLFFWLVLTLVCLNLILLLLLLLSLLPLLFAFCLVELIKFVRRRTFLTMKHACTCPVAPGGVLLLLLTDMCSCTRTVKGLCVTTGKIQSWSGVCGQLWQNSIEHGGLLIHLGRLWEFRVLVLFPKLICP